MNFTLRSALAPKMAATPLQPQMMTEHVQHGGGK